MPGLVPGIPVLLRSRAPKDVDGREKPRHDGGEVAAAMSLIGRVFIILFGLLAACFVAGAILVGAVLFPALSDFADGPIDPSVLNIVLGFGVVFVSGFALLPALLLVLITEVFDIRGALAYAAGGGLVGL